MKISNKEAILFLLIHKKAKKSFNLSKIIVGPQKEDQYLISLVYKTKIKINRRWARQVHNASAV